MKPVPEWRRVLRHAWSVRINIACTVFSAAGTGLSLVNADAAGHPYLIPALAFGFLAVGNGGAIAARVVQQKKLSGRQITLTVSGGGGSSRPRNAVGGAGGDGKFVNPRNASGGAGGGYDAQ